MTRLESVAWPLAFGGWAWRGPLVLLGMLAGLAHAVMRAMRGRAAPVWVAFHNSTAVAVEQRKERNG